MDINNLNSNPLLDRRSRELATEEARADRQRQADGSSEVGSERKPADVRGARAQDVDPQDQVTLSTEARALKRLEAQVAGADSFDGDRVEQIRAAIAEGRYHVDAERLADKFLELENLLNQKDI